MRTWSVVVLALSIGIAAACSRDPKNIDGLILMGNALAGLKDFEGSVSMLQDAIDRDPTQVMTYANLAIVQARHGDKDAAEGTFERAVALAPNSAAAHWSLGNYY